MSEWVFIDIPDRTIEGFAGCDYPFPVRKDRMDDFEKLSLEMFPVPVLVDELDEYLDEFPNRVDRYREAGAYLALCAAVDTTIDNCREQALDYFRLSLWFDESNLAVRMSYAVALHALERRDEAIAQYWIIIATADIRLWWRAWMLCAQALLFQGRHQEALFLLRDAAKTIPDEDLFWDTLAEAEGKAAPQCPACGADVPAGAGFCGFCGARLG
jgi:tetratricopeptide (TPR) repeat protein